MKSDGRAGGYYIRNSGYRWNNCLRWFVPPGRMDLLVSPLPLSQVPTCSIRPFFAFSLKNNGGAGARLAWHPHITMAKPLPVASSGLPGSSKTTPSASQHTRKASNHPRQRTRRPSKPPLSIVAPSSGLLSLLASIVSATTVNGSPAPPDFLCPSIRSENTIEPVVRRRTAATEPRSKADSFAANFREAHHVPVRYDKGPDGLWRRVGSYTLYGSTVSPSCTGVSIFTLLCINNFILFAGLSPIEPR